MSIETRVRSQQIRDELLELMLAEGFRSLSLADLARHLRCSKTTLYALGASKEQITVSAVKEFFRQSALLVEARTAVESGAAEKIVVYLRTVAESLRRASPEFISDLTEFQPAREIYEQNLTFAAGRVTELIDNGVATGEFRGVHAKFVADTIAATMQRIQAGRVKEATGLSDAEAFEEIADLVLNGIRSAPAG